jgi:hypothetical protein
MDAVFFAHADEWAKTSPKTMGAVGTVGYWGCKIAVPVTEGIEAATMPYILVEAPAALALSMIGGTVTSGTMLMTGANREQAAVGGAVATFMVPELVEMMPRFSMGRMFERIKNENGFLATGPSEVVGGGRVAETNIETSIQTPYGMARQDISPEAISALKSAQAGAPLYRQGTLGVQQTAEGQFWSLKNPLSEVGYAEKMGLPEKGSGDPDWIISGRLKLGAQAITRRAPGLGNNPGGDIEVVVNSGDVEILWFHGRGKR